MPLAVGSDQSNPMTPTVFFILVTAIALGVILILWGRRGKRLNKNPTCRDCRFDLTGVYPESITCPECGGGLNRHRAIRAGARKTRWLPIALGIPLILLPGATLALVTFAAITGQNVNDYKPLGLLLWEGEHGTEELVQASGEYLLDQYKKGKFTPEEIHDICNSALRIQGNADQPWHESWGDFLEVAHTDGILSDEEFKRYKEQAAVVEVRTRERVLVGEPVPLRAEITEWRVGSNTQLSTSVVATRYALRAERAPQSTELRYPPIEGGLGVTLVRSHSPAFSSYYAGGIAGFQSASAGKAMILPDLVAHHPGPSTLTLDTRLTYSDMTLLFTTSGALLPESGNSPTLASTQHVLSISVVESEALLKEAKLTEDLRSQIHEKLKPNSARLTNFVSRALAGVRPRVEQPGSAKPERLGITIAFATFNPPVDLAFDLYIEQNGRTWRIGALVSKQHIDPYSVAYVNASNPTTRIVADVKGLERAPWTLRLVPSPTVAAGTLDITRIFSEELVYENVEFTWHAPEASSSQPERP